MHRMRRVLYGLWLKLNIYTENRRKHMPCTEEYKQHEKHRSNESVLVTETNQCQLLPFFFLFYTFFFTCRNALKLMQQYIYNKINGRQIVSTASDCGSFFRIACTQTIALAFNLTSAQCLEVNNKRMKKKKKIVGKS